MSPKDPAPRIRLAQTGSQGGSLYNAYHLLTQIATLYSRGGELDHHPHAPAVWAELCDGVLTDLGDVFSAWELVLNVKEKPATALDEKRLGAQINRACLRMDRALAALSVWTPLAKWLTLARLAERRWQKVAAELAAREPRVKPRLDKARLASQDRFSRVTGLWEKHDKIRQQMAQFDQLERQLASGEEPS